MTFSFDGFIDAVRQAARQPDGNRAVCDVLRQTVANPQPITALVPEDGEDEELLFEDPDVSIWRCRFQPHVVMPPHEHLVDVHIGTVTGAEKSLLFKRIDGELIEIDEVMASAGEVISLAPDAIHAVTADGETPSLALHVYMGPLTTLKRNLFDWETGATIDFSQASFERLKRPA